jgi:hypothetical protein
LARQQGIERSVTITTSDAVAAGQYQVPDMARRIGGQPGINLAGRARLSPNPAFGRVEEISDTSDAANFVCAAD